MRPSWTGSPQPVDGIATSLAAPCSACSVRNHLPLLKGRLLVAACWSFVEMWSRSWALNPLAALRLRHPGGAGVSSTPATKRVGAANGPCPDDQWCSPWFASMALVADLESLSQGETTLEYVQACSIRQFAAQISPGLQPRFQRLSR